MADTELLQCPFCGSSELTICLCEYGGHSAVCGNCEAEGPRVRSQEDATAAWNKRFALASRPAEVDGSPVDQACARVRRAEAELKAARKALMDVMTTAPCTNG
jgi:Lar family restriction alleviation protein